MAAAACIVGCKLGTRAAAVRAMRHCTYAPDHAVESHLTDAAPLHLPLRSYTVMSRDANCNWQELASFINSDAGKPSYVSGSTSVRSFQIAGLPAGLHQVKVWGSITHPNGKDGSDNLLSIEVKSTEVTSAGDSDGAKTYMRDGTIAVGTPGGCQRGGLYQGSAC